jgi:hypothetical protein
MVVKANISIPAMKVIIHNFYFVEKAKFDLDKNRPVHEAESKACEFIVKMQEQIAEFEEKQQKAKELKTKQRG